MPLVSCPGPPARALGHHSPSLGLAAPPCPGGRGWIRGSRAQELPELGSAPTPRRPRGGAGPAGVKYFCPAALRSQSSRQDVWPRAIMVSVWGRGSLPRGVIYSETSTNTLCQSFQVLRSFSFSLDVLQQQRREGKQEGSCGVRAPRDWDVSRKQKRGQYRGWKNTLTSSQIPASLLTLSGRSF